MTDKLYVLDTESPTMAIPEAVPVASLRRTLRDNAGDGAIMVMSRSGLGVRDIWPAISTMLRLLPQRRQQRHERRIDEMLDVILDFDPLSASEAKIDLANAEMRRAFLAEFPVIDAATVHERAGYGGRNKAQTAASWRAAGRILGLSLQGRVVFPVFQFNADGQPLPLLRKVLGRLPADRTDWQRAFWLVAPNEWLDGGRPIDLIRAGNEDALAAAAHEAEPVIG